jgi:hypothetical protein
MTGQVSRAQRRRASRSTAISATTTSSTQSSAHPHPGMARLLPSGSVAERDCVTPAKWWLPARNGLHAALAGGTLHPPAPAVCLLDGLPPRRLRGQGSLRAHECSLGLRRPLTAPASRRPGETSRPGRARSSARPAGRRRGPWRTTPGTPPPPAPADPQPGRRTGHRLDHTATDQPAPSLSPEEGTACPTPTSPSPAT